MQALFYVTSAQLMYRLLGNAITASAQQDCCAERTSLEPPLWPGGWQGTVIIVEL